MLDKNTLQKILSDPDSTPAERALAQRRLDAINPLSGSTAEEFSPDAAALLADTGKTELFGVTAPELDAFCELRGIDGERRTALRAERAEYLTPPEAILRLSLADPATAIEWAVLLHWRNTYEYTTWPRARRFAVRIIEMVASYAKVPADVRAAASGFLDRLKADHPVPDILLPDADQWQSMSNDALYERMEQIRSLFNEASNG